MDIRDYEYIVRIAECSGISKAAAQLFITQPALTRFLQRTEDTLGLKLFSRQGHRFILTDAGRAYVETGRQIIELDKALSAHLEDAACTQKRLLRVGCPMGRSSAIFQDVLPRFYERFPDIELRLRPESSRRQMDELKADQLDMAMVISMEEEPGYRYIPLDISVPVLAVRRDSPLIELAEARDGYPYPVISLREIQDQRFLVMDPGTRSGDVMTQIFKLFPEPPRIRLTVSDARGLLTAVEADLGPAIFLSVPPGHADIQYLCLEGIDNIEASVDLVLKQDKTVSHALQHLIDLLRADSKL